MRPFAHPCTVNAEVFTVRDAVREAVRTRHYSARTERAYLAWIRRYIAYHGRRPPRELGAAAVTAFLSSLADGGLVAPARRNQALAALLFLYREVLDIEPHGLGDVARAKARP